MLTLMLFFACAEIVFRMYVMHIQTVFVWLRNLGKNINGAFRICKWIEFIQMEENLCKKLYIFWMFIPRSV